MFGWEDGGTIGEIGEKLVDHILDCHLSEQADTINQMSLTVYFQQSALQPGLLFYFLYYFPFYPQNKSAEERREKIYLFVQ